MATFRKRNGLWQVQIRRKGASPVSKSFCLKSDAEKWARQVEVEIDRSALHFDPKRLEKIKVSDLIELYRDTVSIEKRSYPSEKTVLNALLLRPLAKKNLAQLNAEDIVSFRDARKKEVSDTTVNRNLTLLQHIFEIAKMEWAIPIKENPVSLVRKPKNNPPRERRLRAGEYVSLLNAADACRNTQVKSIIIIAVETAMRRGEILKISRDHFSSNGSFLRIPQTKTGTPRTIALTKKSQEVLSGYLYAADGLLFSMTPNAFRLAWERVKKRAGIIDLHFHDLRHEAISRLFEQGLGVAHVAAISGHKDFRMLARYTHCPSSNNMRP